MEYTKLGSTGLRVSQLCFGTWRFGMDSDGTTETTRDEAHELLDTARESGINFIDTANVYGDPPGTSERWIGEWLEDRDREDIVLGSKVYFGVGDRPNDSGAGRKHVRAQIDGTLDRLGTDYLDVYYVHCWDDETPIEETLRTLDDLIREGKVHHLGISNTAAWQLTKALWTSDVVGLERFEITQPRFNAAFREAPAEFLDVCADQDLAVCPYSPLEAGLLTGKYERGEGVPEGTRGDLVDWDPDERFSDRQWNVLDVVRSVADEADATPAQVAIRWLVDRKRFTCVPIVGARTPEQLEENVAGAEISLTDEQARRIADAYDA
jgi:aryl-alcohol dehydrogenase-like predicted oxidoreductase